MQRGGGTHIAHRAPSKFLGTGLSDSCEQESTASSSHSILPKRQRSPSPAAPNNRPRMDVLFAPLSASESSSRDSRHADFVASTRPSTPDDTHTSEMIDVDPPYPPACVQDAPAHPGSPSSPTPGDQQMSRSGSPESNVFRGRSLSYLTPPPMPQPILPLVDAAMKSPSPAFMAPLPELDPPPP